MSRLAVFAVITLVVLNAASALFAHSVPNSRTQKFDRQFTIIYVGAKNCAPCEVWEREHKQTFMDSPQYGALNYREVIAPSLKDVLSDDVWPADLRRYRDGTRKLMGAPSWLVVEDEKVVAVTGGLSNWKKNVLPFLKINVH